MDNDQIKQQIESAKRAFIASRNQQGPNSKGNKFSENDRQPIETNIQKDILDRSCAKNIKKILVSNHMQFIP